MACKDTPGFVVNRILIPMLIDAARVFEAGVASAEDIDTAMKLGANLPMGPLELMDFTGVDIAYPRGQRALRVTKEQRFSPPTILRKMVKAGHLGRKSGKGFYDYTDKADRRRRQTQAAGARGGPQPARPQRRLTSGDRRGNGMIRDEKHECMKRGDLKKLQGDRLAALVQPPLRECALLPGFPHRGGRQPENGQRLDDLARLPFTYKRDLRDTYPFGMFAVPDARHRAHPRLVRHHRQTDHRRLHAQRHRHVGGVHGPHAWPWAGVTPDDIIQNAYGYGLFTGGLGAHYGGERLGAAVIPISGRQHPEATHADAGLRNHGLVLHPQLRPLHLRRGSREGIDMPRCP